MSLNGLKKPLNKNYSIEIALISDDLANTHNKALSLGAKELKPIALKPWGQQVSYVLSPQNTLIELASPIA